MPAKSEKQRRFMAAVANNPKFAKKVGVPKSVGEEYMKSSYADGGMMSKRPKPRPKSVEMTSRALENYKALQSPQPIDYKSKRPKARPRSVEKSRGEMMARDEMLRRSSPPPTEESITRGLDERGEMMSGYKSGGKVKKMAGGGSCGTKMYAKGGKVRGDGVCSKGHTKGRMV